MIGAFKNAGVPGSYFEGSIDDVRIYSRALNENEVRTLADQPPISGMAPIAHWKLDGDCTDASGNHHDGTEEGSPVYSDGMIRDAISLNGTDQYISIPHDSQLKPQYPLTLSAWVNVAVSGTDGFIIMTDYSTNQYKYSGVSLRLQNGGTNKVVLTYGDGTSASPTGRGTKVGTTILQPGRWYHVVGVICDPEDMSIYVNGVDDGGEYTGTSTRPIYYEGHESLIGSSGSQSIIFNGMIDDVRIYNYGLSQAEVKTLYQTRFSDGGGIKGHGASTDISMCIIKENTSETNGGGIADIDGTLSNCFITNNESEADGGGLAGCDGDIVNCVIAENTAENAGAIFGGDNGSIINCTVANNIAGNSVGGIKDYIDGTVTNTILWDNMDTDATTNTQNTQIKDCVSTTVTYSCVQDETIDDGRYMGTGNIDDNPEFIGVNDYHLFWWSACIDSGDPTIDYSGQFDIDNYGRSIGPVADIGAYEWSGSSNSVIYVDGSVATSGNGSSWASPYKYLQDALDAAQYGDQIWVADGIYHPDEDIAHPTGTGNKNDTFQLIEGVGLYGGFAGSPVNESSIYQRDWTANETILCGDIDEDGDVDYQNTYHVVTGADNALVDGFIIRRGNNSTYGSGVLCSSDSITINNCTIRENNAEEGAGINCYASSVTINNSTISYNEAEEGSGGGICCSGISHLTINNSTISHNYAEDDGGGIYCDSSSLVLSNCTITSNHIDDGYGAGIYCYDSSDIYISNCNFLFNGAYEGSGGGVAFRLSSGTITKSVLNGNEGVYDGGGIYIAQSSCCSISDSIIKDNYGFLSIGAGVLCDYNSNATISNCLISGNTMDGWGYGGGIGVWDSSASLYNCLIYDNYACDYGGGLACESGSLTVTNCVIAANASGENGGAIYFLDTGSYVLEITNTIIWNNNTANQIYRDNATANLRHCCIEDCGGSGTSWNNNYGTDMGGNIEDTPLFFNAEFPEGADGIFLTADDGLQLTENSPCIDAADGDVAPWLDILGCVRIDNNMMDKGIGTPPYIDMGCYEYESYPFDADPPSPDPMTWEIAPHATGETSISMTATLATDDRGVEYRFECVAGGGDGRDWQDSRTYEDMGLLPEVEYRYRVQARDKSTLQNVTGWSEIKSVVLTDNIPPEAVAWVTDPHATSDTAVSMTVTAADASGKEYWFYETSGNPGGTSSTEWQDSDTYVDDELQQGYVYAYQFQVRDKSPQQNPTTLSEVKTGTPIDITPPNFDPQAWATEPYIVSETAISMTAPVATDISGVQYSFVCVSGGGHDSGWQDSQTYVVNNLQPGNTYVYKVQARDKSPQQNTTGWSDEKTVVLIDTFAPHSMEWAVNPHVISETAVSMTATAVDASDVEYWFYETSGNPGGTSSIQWQDSPTYIDDALQQGYIYTYRFKARDKSPFQNEAGLSSEKEVMLLDTIAPTPDPMEWYRTPYATGHTSIAMTAVTAVDFSGVEYYFENITFVDGSHDSGWQSEPIYEDIGLDSDTIYSYKVCARDTEGNITDWSDLMSATTGNPSGVAESVSGELGNDLNIQVQPFTGTANYSVPIQLPPGRQGSEPELTLSYNSGGGNSLCGVGWTLGIGAIHRNGKEGVPVKRSGGTCLDVYDDDKGFVISFSGVDSRLILIDEPTGLYRAENDKAFMKYVFDKANNQWIVTDKSGNKYYFGETSNARLVHPDFVNSEGKNTFMWALESIVDINGNQTVIEYSNTTTVVSNFATTDQDAGGTEFYLKKIRYNGNVKSDLPLPCTHTVDFVLEDRQDKSISFSTGFAVSLKKRLSAIVVKVDGVLVCRYELDYDYSTSTKRSLLTSVTQYGKDGNALPPVSFDYSGVDFEFGPAQDWENLDLQGETGENWGSLGANDSFDDGDETYENIYVSLMDLNGDGLTDRVMRNNVTDWSDPQNTYKVQFNMGTDFSAAQDWGPLDGAGYTIGDLAKAYHSLAVTQSETEWFYDNISLDGAVYTRNAHYQSQKVLNTYINSDSFVDRIMHDYTGGGNFKVQLNTGEVQIGTVSGYAESGGVFVTTNWGPIDNLDKSGLAYEAYKMPSSNLVLEWSAYVFYGSGTLIQNGEHVTDQRGLIQMIDINGDGLPDRVIADPGGSTAGFMVQFNTGSGFEETDSIPATTIWGPIRTENKYLSLQHSSVKAGYEYALDGEKIASRGNTVACLMDVNGDGLPDRVQAIVGCTTSQLGVFDDSEYIIPSQVQGTLGYLVQFNTGYGFEQDDDENPLCRIWLECDGQGANSSMVYYTGHMYFKSSPDWYSIQATREGCTNVSAIDINGDALPDRVMRKIDTPYDRFVIQLNTGYGFSEPLDWTGVTDPDGGTSDEKWCSITATDDDSCSYVSLMDINGDGLPDRVMRKKTADYDRFRVQLNRGQKPDMLTKITGKLGGSAEIEYDRSNNADNFDQHEDNDGVNCLPAPVYTVSSITIDDGMGTAGTTAYEYKRGYYDNSRREFAGFGHVEITTPDGVKAVNYFHQGGGYDQPEKGEFQDNTEGAFVKKGILYRTEIWGSDGLLYNMTINKVEHQPLTSFAEDNCYIAFISRTINLDFAGAIDETGAYRATATDFEYDISTGNRIRTSSWFEVGGVDIENHSFSSDINPDDDVHEHVYYKTFTNNSDILDKPERRILTDKENPGDPSAEKLKESFYFYDEDLPDYCQYTDSRGNLGKISGWYDQEDRYIDSYIYYDEYGNAKASIDSLGIVTVVDYDNTYRMYAERSIRGTGTLEPATFDFVDESDKFITQSNHDPLSGALINNIDVIGIETEYVYDEFFRLTEVYRSTAPGNSPMQLQTVIEYNPGGITGGAISQNYVHQRHNGYEAYIYNDGLGRITQSRIMAETGAPCEYRVTNTYYNEMGQPYFVSVPYFDNGHEHIPNPSIDGTLTEYDALGRTWKVTPPPTEDTDEHANSPTGPATTEYGLDDDPWITVTTDAENNVTRTYLNARQETEKLVEVMTVPGPYEAETEYTYDRLGRLRTIRNDADIKAGTYDQLIEYDYDNLDRKIGMTDPDMDYWSYTYNDGGQLTEQIDAEYNRIEMSYNDEIGRLTEKRIYSSEDSGQSYQLVDTVTYIYDRVDDTSLTEGLTDPETYTVCKGRLYLVVDDQGWEKYSYDLLGRQDKSTRYLNITPDTYYTTTQTFNNAGRIANLKYPLDTAEIEHSYDSAGNLVGVRSLSGTSGEEIFYAAHGFNAMGQLTGYSLGNGLQTRYTYFPISSRRQSHITDYGTPGDTTDDLQSLSYRYDKVNNLLAIQDSSVLIDPDALQTSSGMLNIQYDSLYRLTQVTYQIQAPTGFTGFSYDYSGNILSNDEAGGSGYTYNPALQPHAVRTAYGHTYDYDNCGNMTQRGIQRLYYNAENELESIDLDNDQTIDIEFGYGADGQRLWKKKDGVVTNIWIGSIFEYKDDGGTGRVLCHVNTEVGKVCTFEPNPTEESVFYYYHSDHLGSSSVMTDRNGDIVKHYGYSVFGDERWDDDDFSANMAPSNRYTGQILDEDTGLYYYNARYYDPMLGRFIQPDTVLPSRSSQGLNRYTYAANNPLKFTDPSGHYNTAWDWFNPYVPVSWNINPGAYYGTAVYSVQLDFNVGSFSASHIIPDFYDARLTDTPFLYELPSDSSVSDHSIWQKTLGYLAQKAQQPTSFDYTDNAWADFGNMIGKQFTADISGWALGVLTAPGDYYDSFRDAGAGKFISGFSAANMSLGKVFGYSTFAEGLMGIDVRSTRETHGWERAAQIGIGTVQTGLSIYFTTSAVSKFTGSSATNATPFEQWLNKGHSDVSVYRGFMGGDDVYVGITNNITRRQVEHGLRFNIREVTMGLTRNQARSIEQVIIKNNPGYQNIYNSISPQSPYYQRAIDWGEAYLKGL